MSNVNDFPIIRAEALGKLAKGDVIGVLTNVVDGEPTAAGTRTIVADSLVIGKAQFHREKIVLFSQVDQDAAKAKSGNGRVKSTKSKKLSAHI